MSFETGTVANCQRDRIEKSPVELSMKDRLMRQPTEHGFALPGTFKVSNQALKLAREFGKSIGRAQSADWVVVFDWAPSVSVQEAPERPSKDIGACLMIGAFKRSEIPSGFTQTIEGFEFAIRIPREIWEQSVERVIDIDEKRLFKLAVR